MKQILSPEMSATNQPTFCTNPEGGKSQVHRVESLQLGWRNDKATRSWFAALEGQVSYFCKVSTPALGATQRSSQWAQESFSWGQAAGKLITHIRPLPRLRTSAAVHPRTHIPSQSVGGQLHFLTFTALLQICRITSDFMCGTGCITAEVNDI
jgi:hypothetical protein